MEGERKWPFASCGLRAFCKPIQEQDTALPFSCEALRPPLGFWLTILHPPPVSMGGVALSINKVDFPLQIIWDYSLQYLNTLSLVMFLLFIFLFSQAFIHFLLALILPSRGF